VTLRELTKGQNTYLGVGEQPLATARITVSWQPAEGMTVDVSALLVAAGGRVRSDADFVFYNQPEAEDGAVRLLGKSENEGQAEDRLLINLSDLPPEISMLVVVLSLDAGSELGFGAVGDLAVVVGTVDDQPLARFAVPVLREETALIVGEVYRREGGWRFRAVGQGYASGLAGLAIDYGMHVDTSGGQDVPAADPSKDEPAVEAVRMDLPESPSQPEPGPDGLEGPPPDAGASRAGGRGSVRTKKPLRRAVPVPGPTLADDDSWKASRLFPVIGVGSADEQERRATSSLLSVLMGVKEFGRAITGRLGAPGGLLETYLEVPFPLGEATVIPDGVLRVARAGRVWTALLEVKTGSNLLAKHQVESYLEVARQRGYDAVVTLSNELPASPGEHPVGVDRRKLRKVALHHLAWAEVVHEATMQLSHRGVADPSQAWVLSELLRYLQHPRSGASGFEDMGPCWVGVRDAVLGGTLRASDRKAPQVAASWDRLVRQVCLRKTGELGTDVTAIGARGHAADPAARAGALVRGLVEQGTLTAGLRIPAAVGPMLLAAELRTGQVEVSVDVEAPGEGRPLTRVNWLLRQLLHAPEGLRLEAFGTRNADSRCETLKVARLDPTLLLPVDGAPRTYRLSLALPLGTKRGIGRGGFITSIHEAVDTFYRDVVQGLRPWSPPPPRLPAHDAAANEDLPEASDDVISPA
jgi:stress response protein SCP2